MTMPHLTIMPLHGWTMAVEKSPTAKSFSYNRGYPEDNTFSNILVEIQPADNNGGMREVQLSVSGSEVNLYCIAHDGNLEP
jgi:hypothetical protein